MERKYFFSFFLHTYASRHKLHKKQVMLIYITITVLFRVSLHDQLVSHSRVLKSSPSCHTVITLPDHVLKPCSTTLSRDTQRRLFFIYLCVVHLLVTPNDLSDGRAAIAVSAATALCCAVELEFYLRGVCVTICMKGTLRPLKFSVKNEKKENTRLNI